MTKRAFDLAAGTCVLLFLLPLALLIAVGIRLTSRGPVLCRQRRYGLDGAEIGVWHFRTLQGATDLDGNAPQGAASGARLTPLGRVLRKASMDELPSLLNVIGGSMSVVGPRPCARAESEQVRKLVPDSLLGQRIRPGLTSWTQVNGGGVGRGRAAVRR